MKLQTLKSYEHFFCGLELLNEDTRTDRQTGMEKMKCATLNVVTEKELQVTATRRTVEYSKIQYSTVRYSTVHYITVQYSTVRYSTA